MKGDHFWCVLLKHRSTNGSSLAKLQPPREARGWVFQYCQCTLSSQSGQKLNYSKPKTKCTTATPWLGRPCFHVKQNFKTCSEHFSREKHFVPSHTYVTSTKFRIAIKGFERESCVIKTQAFTASVAVHFASKPIS